MAGPVTEAYKVPGLLLCSKDADRASLLSVASDTLNAAAQAKSEQICDSCYHARLLQYASLP